MAEYEDFWLLSNSPYCARDTTKERFEILNTDCFPGRIAALYVELPDGKRCRLEALPEPEVAKFLERDTRLPASLPTVYQNDADPMRSTAFAFRGGKLVSARIDARSSINLAISPHRDGPYVKLPITRKRMLEVFGEPVKWSSYRPPSGA